MLDDQPEEGAIVGQGAGGVAVCAEDLRAVEMRSYELRLRAGEMVS